MKLHRQFEADLVVELTRVTSAELAVRVSKRLIRRYRLELEGAYDRGYTVARTKRFGRPRKRS